MPPKRIIVGCGKEKRQRECAAKDLYTGQLFRFARAYAEIVFLAGERYINAICDGTFLANYPDKISKPLAGMPIGDRLHWLKQQVVAAGRQGRGSVQPANSNRRTRTQTPKAGGDEE